MSAGGYEVKVGFSHHKLDLAGGAIELDKALCFVLDTPAGEPPTKKRKKKAVKDPKLSAITFGAKMDLQKLVQCKAFEVAWRVRCAMTLGTFAIKCQFQPIVQVDS